MIERNADFRHRCSTLVSKSAGRLVTAHENGRSSNSKPPFKQRQPASRPACHSSPALWKGLFTLHSCPSDKSVAFFGARRPALRYRAFDFDDFMIPHTLARTGTLGAQRIDSRRSHRFR